MDAVAKGTFEVELQPQGDPDASDGVSLGRMSLGKTFHGDLMATGQGTMLTAMTPVKGSAGYVAIERVSGLLHGRRGSFVLQHSGSMAAGAQQLSITVVPGSGTGDLEGLSGRFDLRVEDGQHVYALHYTVPG